MSRTIRRTLGVSVVVATSILIAAGATYGATAARSATIIGGAGQVGSSGWTRSVDSVVNTVSSQQIPVGIQRIGATESPTAKIDGKDDRVKVDVAIIDTGIDKNHPDLNVVGGVNVTGRGARNDYRDRDGHGTMVGGIIGALDNNQGVVGVAPGARLWAVRAYDPDSPISHLPLVRGLNWVADHADTIDVVNITSAFSYDDQDPKGGPVDREIHAAIKRVERAGVTVVVSAGNESSDTTNYTPARYDEVVAVSAFTDTDGIPGGRGPDDLDYKDDNFAPFSNFGAEIDLSAPGTGIRSTWPRNKFKIGDGTSFSAPHVAGAAALFLATHPNASPEVTKRALLRSREQVHLPGDPDTRDEGVVNVKNF